MAVNPASLLAPVALGVALAACDSPDPDRVAAVVQAECTGCVDPESTADQSYVSIGVMPAPYPIDWSTPNQVYGTTIATSAAGQVLPGPVHSIGHVLLKVRCGSAAPVYISQTGATDDPKDPYKQLRQLQKLRANMLFETFDDGKLYKDVDAAKDWNDSTAEQAKLAPGTYDSDPAKLAGLVVLRLPDDAAGDKAKLRAYLTALPKVSRHRFVRATIRITKDQCDAIVAWKAAYDGNGAARYAVHRAPWVMDAQGNYDGGGCGSVSFAGAFYAGGFDYKKVAERLTVRLQIGTARLTESIARDNRKMEGWYLLQDDKRYVPGAVPCAKDGAACKAAAKPWFDALYDKWNGPEDAAETFSKAWGTGKDVKSATLPFVAFEPEKFYREILTRWNQNNHDAFSYPGWCKIDGKVPTIVLDGRTDGAGKDRTGRKAGLKGGFDNPEVKLF